MRMIATACFAFLLAAMLVPTLAYAQCEIDGCPEIYPTLQYGFGVHPDARSDYDRTVFDSVLGQPVFYYGYAEGFENEATDRLTCMHIFFDVRNCGVAIGKMVVELQDSNLCDDRTITIKDYTDPHNPPITVGTIPSSHPGPFTYTPQKPIQPHDTGSVRYGFCGICGCQQGTLKMKVTLFKEDRVTPVCPHPIYFYFNFNHGCDQANTPNGTHTAVPMFSVAPNPATNTITVSLSAIMSGATVRLVTADGHDALSTSVRPGDGPLTTQLDTRSLASGTYMIVLDGQINGQHHMMTQKVIIIKH